MTHLPRVLLLAPMTLPAPADAPCALLIRGGRVADGTGSPRVRADVAIHAGGSR